MSDIEPHELSAYLDGELNEDRRRSVADALASDPVLRAEFEALSGLDTAWRQAARAAAFRPSIRLPKKTWSAHVSAPAAAAMAVGLVVLKLAPKFSEGIAIGLAVHAIALAIAVAGIAVLAVSDRSGATAPPR